MGDVAFKNAAAIFYDSAASNKHMLARENSDKLMYDAENVIKSFIKLFKLLIPI